MFIIHAWCVCPCIFLFCFGIPSLVFVWILSAIARKPFEKYTASEHHYKLRFIVSTHHSWAVFPVHLNEWKNILESSIMMTCLAYCFFFRRLWVWISVKRIAFTRKVFRGCPQSPRRSSGMVLKKKTQCLLPHPTQPATCSHHNTASHNPRTTDWLPLPFCTRNR